jgi:hypothetical protein
MKVLLCFFVIVFCSALFARPPLVDSALGHAA